MNLFLRGDSRIITADYIRAGIPGGAAHQLIHGAVDPVIAVHEGRILPSGMGKTVLSGTGVAAVWLMETVNEVMLCGISITDIGRAVCRAVIYQQQFIICPLLCEDAVDTAGKVFFNIIYGYDDAQKRCG